jgi:hypothetical protein
MNYELRHLLLIFSVLSHIIINSYAHKEYISLFQKPFYSRGNNNDDSVGEAKSIRILGDASNCKILSQKKEKVEISLFDHEEKVHLLTSLIKSRLPNQKITLQRRPSQSHCPRPHDYKENSIQLDFSSFTDPISIELLTKESPVIASLPKGPLGSEFSAIVDVQAMISYEKVKYYCLEIYLFIYLFIFVNVWICIHSAC